MASVHVTDLPIGTTQELLCNFFTSSNYNVEDSYLFLGNKQGVVILSNENEALDCIYKLKNKKLLDKYITLKTDAKPTISHIIVDNNLKTNIVEERGILFKRTYSNLEASNLKGEITLNNEQLISDLLNIATQYEIRIDDYKLFELLLKILHFYGKRSLFNFFEDLIKMPVLPEGFFYESPLPFLFGKSDGSIERGLKRSVEFNSPLLKQNFNSDSKLSYILPDITKNEFKIPQKNIIFKNENRVSKSICDIKATSERKELEFPKLSSEIKLISSIEYKSTFKDCDVCGVQVSSSDSVTCFECHTSVHLKCFGFPSNQPLSFWSCERCLLKDYSHCSLCLTLKGALKKTEKLNLPYNNGIKNSGWVHLLCANVVPGLKARNLPTFEPIFNLELIDQRYIKSSNTCSFCSIKNGVIVKCGFDECKIAFHPRCALLNECKIIIPFFNQGKIFCLDHKEKVFNDFTIHKNDFVFTNPSNFGISPSIKMFDSLNSLSCSESSKNLEYNQIASKDSIQKEISDYLVSEENSKYHSYSPTASSFDDRIQTALTSKLFSPPLAPSDYFNILNCGSLSNSVISSKNLFCNWNNKDDLLFNEGISFNFNSINLKFNSSLSSIRTRNPPPTKLRLRSEITVNSFKKNELLKPLYDFVFQRGADFEIRVFIGVDSAISSRDFDIHDYFREKQEGFHMFITNMCEDELLSQQYAMFLYPKLLHSKEKIQAGKLEFLFSLRIFSLQTLWNFKVQSYLNIFSKIQRPLNIADFSLNVVLDIDKTLLLSVKADECTKAQMNYSVKTITADGYRLNVMVRPGLNKFLTNLSRHFRITLCTMGSKEYLDEIFHFLKQRYSSISWSHAVTAIYTRIHSNKKNGYKDLKMIYPFCHFEKWSNNVVIVDDTKDVWLPQYHKQIYQIERFDGPMSDFDTMIINPNDMDVGLTNCWKKILEVKTKYLENINLIDKRIAEDNLLSSFENLVSPDISSLLL